MTIARTVVANNAMLAGAFVVVVAGTTSCHAKPVAAPATASSAADSAGIVGYRWLLTELSTPRGHISVPQSFAAAIQFTTDGKFLASDSVNSISGSYTSTNSGFSPTGTSSTLVGVGGTPQRLSVVAGMDAITEQSSVTVTRASTPSTVLMTVPGYSLTLRRTGPATTSPTALPS